MRCVWVPRWTVSGPPRTLAGEGRYRLAVLAACIPVLAFFWPLSTVWVHTYNTSIPGRPENRLSLRMGDKERKKRAGLVPEGSSEPQSSD